MEKRENATIWESKSNGCYEFQCHNDSGPIFLKQCNNANEVCENDQCVVKEEVPYYVEIEMEGISVNDLNINEIQTTLSDLTGIEMDKLRIRFDTNEKNEIISIIVIVDDEKTAEIISKSVNTIIDEGLCQDVESNYNYLREDASSSMNVNCSGILKYVKSAKVVEVAKNSSSISEQQGDDQPIVMYIFIGIIILAAIVLSVVIIIISVVCHKRKKTKKALENSEVITTDGNLYIVEGTIPMTDLSQSTSQQPTSDNTSSNPESDATLIQAF